MSDKELWELMSIICEGQDSEQRREVEQYITDLQKEIERLNKRILTLEEQLKEAKNCLGIISPSRELIEGKYWKNEEIERLNKELENLEKLNKANYQSFIEVNNIINELEKWLDEEYQYYDKKIGALNGVAMGQINRTKNKLQELKGSDKQWIIEQ